MHLRTVVGAVELRVWRGKNPASGKWGCPIRQAWGLKAHQQMSPALEDRLAFTATLAGSYAQAALLAEKWGYAVDASVIHALVQRLGKQAEAQGQARANAVTPEREPQRAAAELAVIMVDGWQARFRGPGWGRRPTRQERVQWHEIKMGVFYRQDQAGQTESGRGVLANKVVVRWQGEPLELGRRLHEEGLRAGSARAQNTLAVGDGAKWIWNLVQDRWPQARQALDFYHASEHLWELGRAYHRGDERQTRWWVEARLHRLRHGKEQRVLAEIAGLKVPRGEAGQIIRREQAYFAEQAGPMRYKDLADRGWPIGSGAVESACRQSQCRFKRAGQFWTQRGLRHLSALDEARHNGHWDQLWLTA